MPRAHLTRRERLALARAALGGFIAGATRALVAWLFDEIHA